MSTGERPRHAQAPTYRCHAQKIVVFGVPDSKDWKAVEEDNAKDGCDQP